MGEALTEIPHMDLADYEAGGRRREEFNKLAMRAFHDIGFAFFRTPPELAESSPYMYEQFKNLFSLPTETKQQYDHPEIHRQRGWTPPNVELGIMCRTLDDGKPVPNAAENWFVGPNADAPSHLAERYPELYSPNIWPKEVPNLQAAIDPVYNSLYSVGSKVMRALTDPLGLEEDYFDRINEGGATLFRPLHYRAIQPEETKRTIGACDHTDINLMTVLPAPTRKGLWVQRRDGVWTPGHTEPDKPGEPGELIVQVGDMLQQITGGYFLSAVHKVLSPRAKDANDPGRYSSALFIHPVADAPLEAIPHLTEKPENFPTIGAGEFLQQRLADINMGGDQLD